MHFYQLNDGPHGPTFHATQSDAHNSAKVDYSQVLWTDLRIELIDIPVDKAGVLALLNGKAGEFKPLRTWKLTPRGGMIDCPNGE